MTSIVPLSENSLLTSKCMLNITLSRYKTKHTNRPDGFVCQNQIVEVACIVHCTDFGLGETRLISSNFVERVRVGWFCLGEFKTTFLMLYLHTLPEFETRTWSNGLPHDMSTLDSESLSTKLNRSSKIGNKKYIFKLSQTEPANTDLTVNKNIRYI